MKIVQIVSLLFISALSLAPVWTQAIPEEYSGTWYRFLEEPAESFLNSNYRLELWSFGCTEGSKVSHVVIFPQKDVRTHLERGYLKFSPERKANPRFILEEEALGYFLDKPQGFPMSTYLDMKGAQAAKGVRYLDLDSSGKDDELIINGFRYHSMQKDLEALLTHTADRQSSENFVRFIFVNIYIAQTQIPGFGTASMMGIDERLPGYISGYVDVQFKSGGLLGITNAGVEFKVVSACEFPGIYLNGNLFGTSNSMNGYIDLSLADKAGKQQTVGRMSCQLSLEDGLVSGGYYRVQFANSVGAQTQTSVDLPFTVVGR